MSAIRFPVAPRDVPAVKAARRLGLTEAEFEAMRDRLYARGFPRPDPDTGRFDLIAIDDWMDRRSGLTKGTAARDAAGLLRGRLEGWNGGKTG
jgi:hypothetical protein